MAVLCKICFKPITRREDGVMMAMFGRGLFAAHRDVCAPKAKRAAVEVVRTAGELALEAAEVRYPGATKFAKTVITHLRARAATR